MKNNACLMKKISHRLCTVCLICVLVISLCACGADGKKDEAVVTGDPTQPTIQPTETQPQPTQPVEEIALVLPGDEHPYIGTKTATLTPTEKPPAIDGFRDTLYDTVGTQLVLDQCNSYYWESMPQNNSASVYITYDKNFLYLFAEVSDSRIDFSNAEHVWEKDSIGVLMDFNYNRDKTLYTDYDGTGIGYVNISCDSQHEYYHEYLKAPYQSAIAYSAICDYDQQVYYIEMCLPILRDFDGEALGFEVINTDCVAGSRCGVRTWNVDGSQMYQYTHCAGTLYFSENLWQ